MSKPIDFTNMTLDELTPIVSMRPGKEYSNEQLRQARAAFMAILHGETIEPETKVSPQDDKPIDTLPVSAPLYEKSTEEIAVPEEVPTIEHTEEQATFSPDIDSTNSSDDEFILKTNSRLARTLYILYAYLAVPLLALEGLLLLISSVATIVAIPKIPHLFIPVGCAVLYTMAVTIAWHQLLCRTRAGIFINRALIILCILRGFSMIFLWGNTFMGIIFIALFFLFLIFFIGYDNTFIIQSPKKRRGR